MPNRVFYIGTAPMMDNNDCIAFTPSEFGDLLQLVENARADHVHLAKCLSDKLRRAKRKADES